MQIPSNQVYTPYICFCRPSPRIIPLPCPNNCAICIQGVWNPATILNAPHLPTIQLPTRKVTFSPFAKVHHFRPEQWYPSPPVTPQQLQPHLPVISNAQDAQTLLRPPPQTSSSRNMNTQRATQLRSRDHPRVFRSANAKISPSSRSAAPPALSLGTEQPVHYQSPLPTHRHKYLPVHPSRRYRSPHRSRRKLRRFLRFLRRAFRFGC